MVGRALDNVPLLAAIADKAIGSDQPTQSISFVAADGSKRAVSSTRIPGTGSRLIVSIDEAKVAANTNREIRTAYLQLAFVCLFVLLGALIAAEKLIIQPIEMMAAMAKRFGQGDWSARAAHKPAARGIHPAGPRLQRHGGAAWPARARTGRHQ